MEISLIHMRFPWDASFAIFLCPNCAPLDPVLSPDVREFRENFNRRHRADTDSYSSYLSVASHIEVDGGIAVIPDDLPIAPRLPLLGIKAILGNGLRLMIDGKRRHVTLKKGWP
jgi:hypothetical protein